MTTPAWLLIGLLALGSVPNGAQNLLPDTLPTPPVRAQIEALSIPPLRFTPPQAREYSVGGVTVFHLEDTTFPLVDIQVQFRGGVNHVSREDAPAMTALTSLLRTGGSGALSADALEAELDRRSVQLSTGSGGGGSFAAVNVLSPEVEPTLDLLKLLLLEPRFSPEARELWMTQEQDRLRRRTEDPGSLAFAEFNRLVFGDHPVGWSFTEEEISSESIHPDRLHRLHALTHCRDRMLIGVAGDLSWEKTRTLLERFLEDWPACAEPLPEAPLPEMRRGGGVWVLPHPGEQTTLVVAGPGGLRLEDSPDFFASRVAQTILGTGGFTSRLFKRLRTERGLAYGASSVWTTPLRHEGLVGAVTATRPERAVEALELIFEIFRDMRAAPPLEEEVRLAIDQSVHGYVFAFEAPGQIVSRRMADRVQGLPDQWLEHYLESIQAVTPEAVQGVMARHVNLAEMTILLVGDVPRFAPGLEKFGPVYLLHPEGHFEPLPLTPPASGNP
jgi:zinc protease